MEQTEQAPAPVAGITEVHLEPRVSREARMLAESSLLVQKQRKLIVADPARCVVWDYSTRNEADLTEAGLRPLMDSIFASGLQIPLRGRRHEDGTLEIVSGARRLAAIRLLIDLGFDVQLLVELVDMNDDFALRFAHAENEQRADLKPLDRGLFYERAIAQVYKTGAACAEAFGVHKSTISRSLDVVRVATVLQDKIDDPRGISAAKASWLMSQLRDREADADPTDPGSDGERRAEAAAAIASASPGNAADVFRQLREAIEPAHLDGDVEIVIGDDQIVGALKRRPKGVVRMDLAVEAGQVELHDLIEAIRVAMAKDRAI